MKVVSLPTHASPRIVELLEGLLSRARAGEITGVFLYYEDIDGKIEHSRDGMADNQVVFSLELTKRRILEKYG